MLLNTNNGATFPGLTLKAWAHVTAAGALLKSFNVASLAKGVTGQYTITFTNNMATTTYMHKLSAGVQASANYTLSGTTSVGTCMYVIANSIPASENMLHYLELWE